MPLQQQIDEDFKSALREKDADRVGVLRMLKSAIKNKSIEKGGELVDADVIAILRSEVKKRKDAIGLFKQGQREDLADKETAEIAVIEPYLPAQMSEGAIREVISAVLESLPAEQQNFGSVMGVAMKRVAGQADGQLVGTLVKDALAQNKK